MQPIGATPARDNLDEASMMAFATGQLSRLYALRSETESLVLRTQSLRARLDRAKGA